MNGLPPNRRLRALALSLQRIKNERCPCSARPPSRQPAGTVKLALSIYWTKFALGGFYLIEQQQHYKEVTCGCCISTFDLVTLQLY